MAITEATAREAGDVVEQGPVLPRPDAEKWRRLCTILYYVYDIESRAKLRRRSPFTRL
jgi:hypothetical protein